MSSGQLDGVREGVITDKPKATAGGTDGGWNHATPLKTRYASPTGLMSFDGESAWTRRAAPRERKGSGVATAPTHQ